MFLVVLVGEDMEFEASDYEEAVVIRDFFSTSGFKVEIRRT